MTVREINAAARAGRSLYLISNRWVAADQRYAVRIIAAKRKHGVLFVKALASGKWLVVSLDQIEERP